MVIPESYLFAQPALSLSSHADTVVATLRGGSFFAEAAADAAFDLTRARIRLEGLSAYGVTCALLMNGALRIFSSTPKKLVDISKMEVGTEEMRVAKMENAATILFAVISTVTVLSGTFTTVIFSLMALYSKTALGMNSDAEYLEFFKMTGPIRKKGFQMYVVSLLGFKGSFILSLFLSGKSKLRYYLSGFAFAISLLSCFYIKRIMDLASAILYK